MTAGNKEIAFIKEAIARLDLQLEGLTVLTEIGNNFYFYLPFIAALAGAGKTYAWTATNPYFDCNMLIRDARLFVEKMKLNDRIEFAVNERPVSHVQNADIITNSGFVRPLKEGLLKDSKSTVVIPLMFEAWELRANDIDIEYCRSKNIKVAGTWESHPSIRVFESVGPLAIKLALEAGMEVYQNKILVWSDDEFGTVSAEYFRRMNAREVLMTTDKSKALEYLKGADFIYFCPNHEKRTLISNTEGDAIFSINEIMEANPCLTIVHLYGKFKLEEIRSGGLSVYPVQDGRAEYMSRTLTHIGMQPTLNLLCAGLKVGELLHAGKSSELMQIIS